MSSSVKGKTAAQPDDLQQAEARTREAERQASLSRIRAEIASMRTTSDLQRITPLIWHELAKLGVSFFRCGIFIMDDTTKTIRSFLSTPEGEHLATLTLPYASADIMLSVVKYWRCCEVYTVRWSRQQFIDWWRSIIDLGQIDSGETSLEFDDPPESLSLHFVPFTQGMLYIGSKEPLGEDQIELAQSLADTFSVAYARYDDFRRLESKNEELATALAHLEATQEQLIQSEKMASLGQLTAGIAHEIKNPLNFINNFSNLSVELMEEVVDWFKAKEEIADPDILDIIETLMVNAKKVEEHGRRADAIVKSMMKHASGARGERQRVDLNAFVDDYVNLAYHGMRSRYPDFNVEIERQFDTEAGGIEMVPQEIGQVLVNLFNNAFDAMREKKKQQVGAYGPLLTVATQRNKDAIEIRVSNNGPEIPRKIRSHIFEPFFTTKPAGSGTGLGLSLSYDIVENGHGGSLELVSGEGKGTTFVIKIPD